MHLAKREGEQAEGQKKKKKNGEQGEQVGAEDSGG
jgi:hypothetical protein